MLINLKLNRGKKIFCNFKMISEAYKRTKKKKTNDQDLLLQERGEKKTFHHKIF